MYLGVFHFSLRASVFVAFYLVFFLFALHPEASTPCQLKHVTINFDES